MSEILNQYRELNIANYTHDDVERLSAWSIDAYDHIKQLESELAELREDNKCESCANRGKADGVTQETYCDSCIYADDWRRNNHNAMKEAKNDD